MCGAVRLKGFMVKKKTYTSSSFSLTEKPRKLEKNLPSLVLLTGSLIQSMHFTMIIMMIVSNMMMMIQIMIKRIIKIRMIM